MLPSSNEGINDRFYGYNTLVDQVVVVVVLDSTNEISKCRLSEKDKEVEMKREVDPEEIETVPVQGESSNRGRSKKREKKTKRSTKKKNPFVRNDHFVGPF